VTDPRPEPVLHPRGAAPQRTQLLIELALIVAAALAGFGFLLAPGRAPYSPYSDFVAQWLGVKSALRDSLAAGRGLPLWRLDQFSGTAGLLNPQALYTYPFHLLFWVLPALSAVGPTFWIHFLLAGLSGWSAGLVLGMGAPGRLLTGLGLMFSFKLLLATYAGWLPVVPGIALLPLLFAAVWRVLERPSPGRTALFAFTVALLIHAGHWQLAYYASLILSTQIGVELFSLARSRRFRRLGQTLGALAAGSLLGLGASAYLLLPLWAEAGLVARGRTSLELFLAGHALEPRQLLTLFRPEVFGTPLDGSYPGAELWEDEAYFGIVPLLLAPVGIGLAWRRPRTKLLALWFLATLGLTMDTPLLRWLFAVVPGFHLFRVPARFLFLAAFFGILLAGLGLDALVDRVRASKLRRGAALLAFIPLALVVAEGSAYARRYLAMVPHEQVLPDLPYARFFRASTGAFRIAPLERATINSGWAGAVGLELVTGYDPFNYRHYQQYFDAMRGGERSGGPTAWADLGSVARDDLLDALNVRYLASPRPLSLPPERFLLAARWDRVPVFDFYRGRATGAMYVYENRLRRDRAFFVSSVAQVDGEPAALEALERSDLRQTAVVMSGREAGIPALSPAAPGDSLAVAESRPGLLRLKTSAVGRRFAVISEVWHPGWGLTIDGRAAPLKRTDLALLGTVIEPGSHEVVATFQPCFWREALLVSGLSAALLAALTLLAVTRDRRRAQLERP
jgi:hypothetical protein